MPSPDGFIRLSRMSLFCKLFHRRYHSAWWDVKGNRTIDCLKCLARKNKLRLE